MARLAGDARPEIVLAAALVSRDVGNGHVCLDLRRLAEGPVLADESGVPVAGLSWPDAGAWLAALRESPLVGGAGGVAPLVLDAAGRLYLRRYWEYERRLAAAIRARAAALDESFDRGLAARGPAAIVLEPGIGRAGLAAPGGAAWRCGASSASSPAAPARARRTRS